MNEYWWRSWHGAPMDHKWSVIAAKAGVKPIIVSAIAWALFDYASQQEDRGSVAGFDVETYAFFSGESEEAIRSVIAAMADKGIIKDERLANWEKRQPKSEKEIQRVTEYRKRKKEESNNSEMLRDVTECYTEEIKKREEEEEEEEQKPASAATPVFQNDIQAETIYMRATGFPAIPGRQEDKLSAIDAIRAIRAQQGSDDAAVVYLQGFFREWRDRRYGPSSLAWLTEWAVTGVIPEKKEQPEVRKKWRSPLTITPPEIIEVAR